MPKSPLIYERILKLQKEYLHLKVDKNSLIQLLNEAEVSEQVYNSNAIENSTLTLEETDKILRQINLDRFISERELFEAKNLARVVEYIHKTSISDELDLDRILLLHKMLISNIRDDIAGRFRELTEWVRVVSHVAADPAHVREMLQESLIDYQCSSQEHIVKKIAKFHLQFENIHPFVDGNGRIGRVLNNYLLLRAGHVPINIKFMDRSVYYDAFEEFDSSGKTKIMEDVVGKALSSSYHKRIAYLTGKRIMSLADYSKDSGESQSNLINKANRQTIDAFMEKGVWKIGV